MEATIKTLKDALSAYREAIENMTGDEWDEIMGSLPFSPKNDDWTAWDEKDESIRQELDFIDSLSDDDDAVYITLSYVDDNEMNKVTGITATDGNGDVLLDMDFVVPIDLGRSILDQIQEAE